MEILIADGGSSDSTLEIIKELNKKDKRVILVENPDKYQSFGLNRMIELAKGDVFLRADGHCFYAEDYIEKCIYTLLSTRAKNVGGAQRYKASNYVQAGIALAVKSFLGNGGAKYMNEEYDGYADTVFLGCFWTDDLIEIGGFNTDNITNQDSELNLRLIEKFGESVFISSEIKSWYFPRNSFSSLYKQYFRYGRGRFLTNSLHPKSSPIRGLAPFMMFLLIILYVSTDLILENELYSKFILSVLISVVMLEGLRVLVKERNNQRDYLWANQKEKSTPLIYIHLILSFLIMQMSHFLGFFYQLLRKTFLRVKGW